MRRVFIAGLLLAGVAGILLSLGLGHDVRARAAARPAPAVHAPAARRAPLHPGAVPPLRRSTPEAPPAMPCYAATTCSEHPCVELIGAPSASQAGGSASDLVYAPTAPRPTANCGGGSSRPRSTVPVRSRTGPAGIPPLTGSVSEAVPVPAKAR